MTPQTVTITTARGETFTMNFDGPVSVEVGNLTPPTPSTAPRFKVGDVVYWVNSNGERRYGRVTEIDFNRVYFERLTTSLLPSLRIGEIGMMHVSDLHHDYRTVAGGGWRKCEVGRLYISRDKGLYFFDPDQFTPCGSSMVKGLEDLIEELP